MNIKSKIGCEIKRLRLMNNWSQQELAKRSKVSRSYIQKIEGKNPPDMTLDILAKLAKGLRIPIWKLLQLKD